MKYYIVPMKDGVLDIDYKDMARGGDSGGDTAHVALADTAQVRETWKEITEAEFVAAVPEPSGGVPPDPLAALATKVDLILAALATSTAISEEAKAELAKAIGAAK